MSSAVANVVSPPSPVKSMSSFTSDETSELLAEVDELKADTHYVDFVEAVVTGKDIKEESDEIDPLFDLGTSKDPLSQKCATVAENGDSKADSDEGLSSESDSDEEEDEDVAAEEVSAVTADSEETIPIRMKAEANKRFPPFWKTQMKLQASEANGDHEDEDYSPAAIREAETIDCSLSEGSDSDSEADMEDDEEVVAPLEDDTEVMKALKSGLDEMQLVEAEVEKEAREKGLDKNMLNAISSFDDATYDESVDSEYVQPKDVDETIEAQEEEDERKLQEDEELSSESEEEDGEDMEV